MDSDTQPIKVSFSFFPDDMTALKDRVSELERAGVTTRPGTFLRALIYLTQPLEMHAHAILLDVAQKKKGDPRGTVNISDRPTFELPKDQVKKLDDVVKGLDKAGITATRAFVVRAILRALRDGATIAPEVKAFLEKYPPKPRGWQVACTWKARKK